MKTLRNNFLKTLLALILAISIVSVFLIPKQANAFLGIGDVTFTTRVGTLPSDEKWIQDYILKPAVRIAVRVMLHETTQQIVRWIQGERNVGYIRNPQSFIRSVADKAAGEVLNEITKTNLCGNIGAFLRISLRTPPGLQQKLACSLTDIVQNVESFYRNFNNGGWPAFISASVEPQNNPYGAYLIALEAKAAAESSAVDNALFKLQASYPFLGFEVEKESPNCFISQGGRSGERPETEGPGGAVIPDPAGAARGEASGQVICATEYETLTPGQLISRTLSKATDSGIDFAISAKEIDEAVATIVQALINKLISSTLVNRDTPGGRTDVGDIEFTGVENANFFVARVRDNLSFADAILMAIDNSLRDSYQQLFTLRRNPPPANPEEISAADQIRALEEKVIRLHQSKRNALTVKAELLTLKRALTSTADSRQLMDLGTSIPQFANSLSRIASEAEVAAVQTTSAGNLKWDTVQEIRSNIDSMSSALALIGTMVTEANRIASTTTDFQRRAELEGRRDNLINNHSRPLQNLRTNLTLLKDRLERALRNEDIIAISTESMLALEQVNIPLQNANDAVQAADIVLRRQ